jgi:hypothetical protein
MQMQGAKVKRTDTETVISECTEYGRFRRECLHVYTLQYAVVIRSRSLFYMHSIYGLFNYTVSS